MAARLLIRKRKMGISITKWETGNSGACKLGLETGVSGPSLSESAMNAEKPHKPWTRTPTDSRGASDGRDRGQGGKVRLVKRRGARPGRASESQRLADLEAEVRGSGRWRRSICQYKVRPSREKTVAGEASKATEKLRDSEGRQRELETQAKLAQTKSEESNA